MIEAIKNRNVETEELISSESEEEAELIEKRSVTANTAKRCIEDLKLYALQNELHDLYSNVAECSKFISENILKKL